MLNNTPIENTKNKNKIYYEVVICVSIVEFELELFGTDLQLVRQNMNPHRLHMQRPTFHNVLIHFHRLLEMMSPFYSTIEPQCWQCERTDPEILNKNIVIYIHIIN